MQQSQGRSLNRLVLVLAGSLGCETTAPPAPTTENATPQGAVEPRRDDLPRLWTQVDRATPKLEGRYGPQEWSSCEGEYPCEALTWSPIDLTEPRPTLTVLVTANGVWQTAPKTRKWRNQWSWVDPILSACLGDGLSLHLASPRITRTLVEHDDGFWWTFALDEAGPCELSGGLELKAAANKGRSTNLTARGHRWGSPAAQGFATDMLTQTYGDAPAR